MCRTKWYRVLAELWNITVEWHSANSSKYSTFKAALCLLGYFVCANALLFCHAFCIAHLFHHYFFFLGGLFLFIIFLFSYAHERYNVCHGPSYTYILITYTINTLEPCVCEIIKYFSGFILCWQSLILLKSRLLDQIKMHKFTSE